MEEHTATTNEIARNITNVSAAERHTAQGANDSLTTAKELASLRTGRRLEPGRVYVAPAGGRCSVSQRIEAGL